MAFLLNSTRKFTFVGAAFGFSFPVIGTLVEAAVRSGSLSAAALVGAQRESPLLWIIDTAPFFLGLFASLAGRREDGIRELHLRLAREEEERLRTIPASLTSARDELTPAASSLAELTRSLTDVVQRQASSLEQASATMSEIRQTTSVSATKAETVLEVAGRADALSAQGQQALATSLAGLEEIRSQTDAIAGKIASLSESALQAGEIIESVKDIAEQSHVLALNAAIEASKAGEFGKGFGVVAREIRSLADRSLASTERIRKILGEIGAAIRSTVSITEEGRRRMAASMEHIRASGENLRNITGIVEESSRAARQIAATVRQQDAGTKQMLTAIGEIHTAMEHTVAGIKRAEGAAQDLGRIALHISGIIDVFETRKSA